MWWDHGNLYKSVRCLGVDLDRSLDGNSIAENILKKGNSRDKFLWRHAKILNTNSRKLLASALIQCHFDYTCSAWFSGLQKIYQQKLQILKNKTIRFVLNCSPRTHIGFNKFKIINWIPVLERGKQIKLNNMFRIIHGTAPKYLRDSFSMVSQEHDDRYTRTSVQWLVLPHEKSAGAKSFRYGTLPVKCGIIYRYISECKSTFKGVVNCQNRGTRVPQKAIVPVGKPRPYSIIILNMRFIPKASLRASSQITASSYILERHLWVNNSKPLSFAPTWSPTCKQTDCITAGIWELLDPQVCIVTQ